MDLKLEEGKLKCSKFTNDEILEVLNDLDEETEKIIKNVNNNAHKNEIKINDTMSSKNASDILFSKKNNDEKNQTELLSENKEKSPDNVELKEKINIENKNQQSNVINDTNMLKLI